MATFKEISAADVKTSRSVLNQLVDVIQEDISGSATRKSYQQFVTGGVGPGVTSSLYQTVFDQDFTLQTANPLFDMTVGTYESGDLVTSSSTGTDSNGKLLFPSQSLMMREKVDIYRQYAANLLGDSSLSFSTPFGSTNTDDQVDNAAFISFKRLFTRDKMKRETFAMKMYQFANGADSSNRNTSPYAADQENLFQTATGSASIFTDFGSSTNRRRTFGGEVGNLVDSEDSTKHVGLVFYDAGTVVLNLGGRGGQASQLRAVAGDQLLSGAISCMSPASPLTNTDLPFGKEIMGYAGQASNSGVTLAKFVPDLMMSASVDDIVDHLSQTRFSSGSLTAATFQNNTNINSTLIFCRATADEFNYSSNPTYTDTEDRIRVIEQGQEDVQRSFTYITTVGLYDVNDNLLAVAKLSRPIEKNDEKDLTVRVRLDF